MSKIALDLRQFKHVKSDKKSTTLQHKDGHILTIAHDKLNPESQAQLSALSGISKNAMTPLQNDEMKHKGMASGGSVKSGSKDMNMNCGGEAKMAKGGIPSSSSEANEYGKAINSLPSPKSPDEPQSPLPIEDKTKPVQDTNKGKMAEGGDVHREMYAEGDEVPEYLRESARYEPGNPNTTSDYGSESTPQIQDINDIGGVRQNISPQRQPGPPVDYNPKPKFEGEAGFTPEDFGKLIGHAAHAFQAAKSKVGEAVSQAGQGITQGIKDSSGIDITGADEQQQQNAPQNVQAPADQSQGQAAPQNVAPAVSPSGAMQPVANQGSPAPAAPQGNQPGLAKPPGPANVKATPQGAVNAFQTGTNQAINAQNQAAAPAGQLAAETANINQEGANQSLELQHKMQDALANVNQERMDAQHDYNNAMIKPDSYWLDHSKVATGIGMILAGFNPTNSPNAAINFLQHQMDNKLEADKQNLNAKGNILTSTLAHYKNINDAQTAYRMYQNDAMAQKLKSALPQAQSQLAALQIQNAAGHYEAQASAQAMQLAQSRMLLDALGSSNGDSEEAFHKQQQIYRALGKDDIARSNEAKHVVGSGDAPVDVPEAVRAKFIEHQNFDNMAKRYMDFSRQHAKNWANLNPMDRMRVQNEGASMGKELQAVLGRTLDKGMSEADHADLERILPSDPTKFLPSVAVQPKVKALIDSNLSRYNTTKAAYHLKPTQAAPQDQIVTVKGVQYRKVPGGYEPVR